MSFLGPSLADFLTLPTEQGTGTAASASALSQVAPSILGRAAPASVAAASTGFFGFNIERITTILVGLILIAAGVFLFKPVRETVITAGKVAGKAAAAA